MCPATWLETILIKRRKKKFLFLCHFSCAAALCEEASSASVWKQDVGRRFGPLPHATVPLELICMYYWCLLCGCVSSVNGCLQGDLLSFYLCAHTELFPKIKALYVCMCVYVCVFVSVCVACSLLRLKLSLLFLAEQPPWHPRWHCLRPTLLHFSLSLSSAQSFCSGSPQFVMKI